MDHLLTNKYSTHRRSIVSGDLLIWSAVNSSFIGKIYSWIIQVFTRSEYTHTAIALVEDGRVFFIHATIPKVVIEPLSDHLPFYHIPMNIEWKDGYTAVLKSKVGHKYSILEAILGYFNRPRNDKRWQCAELVNWFYSQILLSNTFGYTPKSNVIEALRVSKNGMYYIDQL